MTPLDVEQQVVKKAVELEKTIDPNAHSSLDQIKVVPYTDKFQNRLDQQNSGLDALTPLNQPGLAAWGVLASRPEIYVVPNPPVPEGVHVITGFNVLLERQALADYYSRQLPPEVVPAQAANFGRRVAEAYAALVPERSPRDFRYATVVGVFDIDAWRQKLHGSGSKGAIPERWWRSALYVTDVTIERQAFDPATGQWGEDTIIPTIPGEVSFRDLPTDWPSKDQASRVVQQIKEFQEKIIRPAFVPTSGSTPWQAPHIGEELAAPIEQADDHIIKLTNQVLALEKEAAKYAPAADMFNVLAGQASKPGEVPANQPDAKSGSERDSLNKYTQITTEMTRLKEELAAVNESRNRWVAMSQAQALLDKRSSSSGQNPAQVDSMTGYGVKPGGDHQFVVPAGRLTIWSHDITVQAGKKYRYRMRLALLNPLFQQEQLLPEQADLYRDKLAMETDFSEGWAEVEIEPELQFFLVDGAIRQQEASVEVWRIFNGQPFSNKFQVKPGDLIGEVVSVPVGSVDQKLDLRTNTVMVDLLESNKGDGGIVRKNLKMLYIDLQSGRLLKRSGDTDLTSPLRVRYQKASEAGKIPETTSASKP
jgi:hypothetical protein